MRQNNNKGFSVIELLFISVLVTVVFTGISLSVLASLKAQNVSRQRKIATELANLVMKDIEFEAIKSSVSFWDCSDGAWGCNVPVSVTETSYQGYVAEKSKKIQDCEMNGRVCAVVTVTVSWQNQAISGPPVYKYSYVLEKKLVKL